MTKNEKARLLCAYTRPNDPTELSLLSFKVLATKFKSQNAVPEQFYNMASQNSDTTVNIVFGIVAALLAIMGVVATIYSKSTRPHNRNDSDVAESCLHGWSSWL